PVPGVLTYATVHGPPALLDTCIWYALAYATSQVSFTRVIGCTEPRSICIHCGSEKALDQRVPRLPSTAYCDPRFGASIAEEVVGFPCEISGPQVVGLGDGDGPPPGPVGGPTAPPVPFPTAT